MRYRQIFLFLYLQKKKSVICAEIADSNVIIQQVQFTHLWITITVAVVLLSKNIEGGGVSL